MKPEFRYLNKPALEPVPGCAWAEKMVLNPAIIKDPDTDDIHMLFRATGPWPQKRREGCHDPYPIFLGYAISKDAGETWDADFSRPALAPALGYDEHELYITDIYGQKVRNYANGCVEDPRIFYIGEELYVSVACRPFPPGPYWLGSQQPPVQTRFEYVPDWIFEGDGEEPFIQAARSNDTVSVLYKLDLDELKQRNYECAFQYVGPLTEGHVSDNRDVFLFPHKMKIRGKWQYVMLHRPMNVLPFEGGVEAGKPSIYLAAAETIADFSSPKALHKLLASPLFDWEENRVGASSPPGSPGESGMAGTLSCEERCAIRIHSILYDYKGAGGRFPGGDPPLLRPTDVRGTGVGETGGLPYALPVYDWRRYHRGGSGHVLWRRGSKSGHILGKR